MIREIIPLALRRALGDRWNSWRASRAQARLLRRLAGDAIACNVCGWRGSSFIGDQWHRGTICPVCRSQVRHRLLVAAFEGMADSQKFGDCTEGCLLAGKKVLHFAPERQLRERIARLASEYVTADFARGDCDLRLDLCSMPAIPDQSFDTLIACDVLEHVPDDYAAFREMARVLAPHGVAILTVPQKDPPSSTDEDSSITDEAQRLARFGQKDHVRMYGDDFAERVAAAGFLVKTLDKQAFPPQIVARHILHPPLPNPSPLATNFRRIYFAQKLI